MLQMSPEDSTTLLHRRWHRGNKHTRVRRFAGVEGNVVRVADHRGVGIAGIVGDAAALRDGFGDGSAIRMIKDTSGINHATTQHARAAIVVVMAREAGL